MNSQHCDMVELWRLRGKCYTYKNNCWREHVKTSISAQKCVDNFGLNVDYPRACCFKMNCVLLSSLFVLQLNFPGYHHEGSPFSNGKIWLAPKHSETWKEMLQKTATSVATSSTIFNNKDNTEKIWKKCWSTLGIKLKKKTVEKLQNTFWHSTNVN